MSYSKSKEVHLAWDRRCHWCDGTLFKGEAVMCHEGAEGGWHWREWLHIDCHDAMGRMDFNDQENWYPGSYIRGTTEQR